MEAITAYILAGGKSSRLETNKALLEIEGRKVIDIIFAKLKLITSNIIISTNQPQDFDFIPVDKIKDIHKDIGPLGGIHSCLTHSETEKNFVISCDLPLMSERFMRSILEAENHNKILLPTNEGKIEFMCGLYLKSTLQVIESILETRSETEGKNKRFSMWNYVHKAEFELLEASQAPSFSEEIFSNLNTIEDYEKIKSLVHLNKALIE
ncbi:MAG: molybdenum cofactor guanylyltransferase [Bacteroidetes bacterium]|nr:molybdenum cofactor guanylyltransferase [Bacteroidota bacterium]